MDNSRSDLLEYFENYDYHKVKPAYAERIKYSRADNITGHQQRVFNYFWALQTVAKSGNLGVEVGSGGVKTPFCLSTDIYRKEPSMTELIVDACDLPFEDGSIELLLANHVLEHLEQPIHLILTHWLAKMKQRGIIAMIMPDGKFNNVMAMDNTHRHETRSDTFGVLYLRTSHLEIIEYDTLNNDFSFNVVIQKLGI
jgi:hypothetical protein